MSKKAQAVTDFLMSYGWILALVLIALAMLVSFGVLDMSVILPDNVQTGKSVLVKDFQVNEDSVTFVFENIAGKPLYDFYVTVEGCLGDGSASSEPIRIGKDGTATVILPCDNAGRAFEQFKSEIEMHFSERMIGATGSQTASGGDTGTYSEKMEAGVLKAEITPGQSFGVDCDVTITACGYTNWQVGRKYCIDSTLQVTSNCFTITANNVILDLGGATIDGDGAGNDNAIIIDGANNVVVQNGEIVNFDGAGIVIRNANHVNVSDILVDNTTTGINVTNSTDVIINLNGNNIDGIGANLPNGIIIEDSSDITILNGSISNFNGAGIVIFNSSSIDISNVTFDADNVSIIVNLSNDVSIDLGNNTLSDNSSSEVQVIIIVDSNNVIIENGIIQGFNGGSPAIEMENVTSVVVENIAFVNVSNPGVMEIDGGSDVYITNISIVNSTNGIAISNSDTVTITDVNMINVSSVGFDISGTDTLIINGVSSLNVTTAIDISASNGNISNVTIINSYDGITASSFDSSSMRNITLINNTHIGISVSSSDDFDIDQIVMLNNTNGIQITSGTNGVISDIISRNTTGGIYIRSSVNTIIEDLFFIDEPDGYGNGEIAVNITLSTATRVNNLTCRFMTYCVVGNTINTGSFNLVNSTADFIGFDFGYSTLINFTNSTFGGNGGVTWGNRFYTSSYILLNNLTAMNYQGYGIDTENSNNLTANNINITGMNTGMNIWGSNNYFINNITIKSSSNWDINISTAYNITIQNSTFTQATRDDISCINANVTGANIIYGDTNYCSNGWPEACDYLIQNCEVDDSGNFWESGIRYCLANDVSSEDIKCFLINYNGINFNGLGHAIYGDNVLSSFGIHVDASNVSIQKVYTNLWTAGIFVDDPSTYVNITNVSSSNNMNGLFINADTAYINVSNIRSNDDGIGINIQGSYWVNISRASIAGTGAGTKGIFVSTAHYNNISDTNISGYSAGSGIYAELSTNLTIRNVRSTSNQYGVYASASNNMYANNLYTVSNSNSNFYMINSNNLNITSTQFFSSPYGLYLVNGANASLRGLWACGHTTSDLYCDSTANILHIGENLDYTTSSTSGCSFPASNSSLPCD